MASVECSEDGGRVTARTLLPASIKTQLRKHHICKRETEHMTCFSPCRQIRQLLELPHLTAVFSKAVAPLRLRLPCLLHPFPRFPAAPASLTGRISRGLPSECILGRYNIGQRASVHSRLRSSGPGYPEVSDPRARALANSLCILGQSGSIRKFDFLLRAQISYGMR